jgi:hypothetical protein
VLAEQREKVAVVLQQVRRRERLLDARVEMIGHAPLSLAVERDDEDAAHR